MKRCFVALELPDATRRALAELQEELVRLPRGAARRLRPVRPEAMHLTLKFLGPTPETQIAPLTRILAALGTHQAPMRLRLAGVGAFPSPARPRAIFVALREGSEPLLELMESLEIATAELGFPIEERPRVPHVTLARAEGARAGSELTAWIDAHAETDLGRIVVRELVLFESELLPRGARYVRLGSAALAPHP